jgi:4-alpha-glucanotransferase
VRNERGADRHALIRALCHAGLWQWSEQEPLPDFSPALARAIHVYLGQTQAALTLVQLEDLLGITDPVNVPGTHTEHANWQRKITLNTREIFQDADVREHLLALNRARGA